MSMQWWGTGERVARVNDIQYLASPDDQLRSVVRRTDRRRSHSALTLNVNALKDDQPVAVLVCVAQVCAARTRSSWSILAKAPASARQITQSKHPHTCGHHGCDNRHGFAPRHLPVVVTRVPYTLLTWYPCTVLLNKHFIQNFGRS